MEKEKEIVFFVHGGGLLLSEIHLAIWNNAGDEWLGMFSAIAGMPGMIITSEAARLRVYDVTSCTLHYRDFSPLYIIITTSGRQSLNLEFHLKLWKAVCHK